MFVFPPVPLAASISVTWIGKWCLSLPTGRSKRLFLRVNHAASHPKCVEAPPQPAADRPDSCNDGGGTEACCIFRDQRTRNNRVPQEDVPSFVWSETS